MTSNSNGEETQVIKVQKITNAAKKAIEDKSAYILPNNPTEAGFTADEIKGTLYKPITDEENSVLAEIDRVIDETNNALGTLTRKHSSDIQRIEEKTSEHSSDIQRIEEKTSEHSSDIQRIDEKTTQNADSIIKTNQRIDEMHVKWVDLKNISEANKDYVKLIYLKRFEYDFVFRPTEIKDTEIRCEIISPLPDRVEYSTSEGEYTFEHIFSNIDKNSVRIVLGDETNFIYIKADYEMYKWGLLYDSGINDECTFYFGANDYNAECICLVGTLDSSIITYPLPLSVTDPEESNDYSAVDVRTMNAKLSELSDSVKTDIESVEKKLENVSNVMDFRGAVDSLPTDLTSYQNGDVIVVSSTGKEYVLCDNEWIELGDTSAEHKAIEELRSSVDALNEYSQKNHIERTYEVAKSGWHRIAESKNSVQSYNGIIQLTAVCNGNQNVSIFTTSGAFNKPPKILPIIYSKYNNYGVEKVRVVYPTEKYNQQKAYLEIFVSGAGDTKTITVGVSTIINWGWKFYENSVSWPGVDVNYPTATHDRVLQNLNDDITMLIDSAEAISINELNNILNY